jgi:hypothetical protein
LPVTLSLTARGERLLRYRARLLRYRARLLRYRPRVTVSERAVFVPVGMAPVVAAARLTLQS